MAIPRLPFLYPNLMRTVRSCEPTTYSSLRIPPTPATSSKVGFHSSRYHSQETYHRRYGPAAEPTLPPPSKPKNVGGAGADAKAGSGSEQQQQQQQQGAATGQQQQPQATGKERKDKENKKPSAQQPSSAEKQDTSAPAEHELQHEKTKKTEFPDDGGVDFTPVLHTVRSRQEQEQPDQSVKRDNPLEEVLHMPSPSPSPTPSGISSSTDSSNRPIHLTPGRYVHHFDTYSLVQNLTKGGFSDDQSVTIMKAIRTILRSNLSLARESLVSKSDVENESYLFQAACSELQSSLQMARHSETQRQRSSRTQLQHEEDIISQRLNQDLAGLRDDIKGMFNDHKMTTREMQRSIDTSIQELNYKITISLNSDGKSTIEGLRWIVARRAALAIATSGFIFIVFLKYYSLRKERLNLEKQKEVAAAKQAAETRATKPVNDISLSDLSETLG